MLEKTTVMNHASKKKPFSWSYVKNGAVKASAAVMPALSGRKKLRILQDHKHICMKCAYTVRCLEPLA